MPKLIEFNMTTGVLAERDLTPEEIAQFTPPPPPPAPRWTSLQFIERFTDSEQLAIVTAAASVPALRLWYDKAMAADEIVADDPRTIAGVQALVTAGLITEQRKTEILGSPP